MITSNRNEIGTATQTGWVWLVGRVIGNPSDWTTEYGWDGEWYLTREDACKAGLLGLGHDDFNVANIEGGRMTWFGWMDEQHPEYEYADVAKQFGWSA